VVKRDTKDYIISISKEFSIVSQFTSFIAVEKRDKVIGLTIHNNQGGEGKGELVY
jgi:hypothetical protein